MTCDLCCVDSSRLSDAGQEEDESKSSNPSSPRNPDSGRVFSCQSVRRGERGPLIHSERPRESVPGNPTGHRSGVTQVTLERGTETRILVRRTSLQTKDQDEAAQVDFAAVIAHIRKVGSLPTPPSRCFVG